MADVFAIQNLSEQMTAAYMIVSTIKHPQHLDLNPFINSIRDTMLGQQVGTTIAVIRKVAEVDLLVELDITKRNNIKLLYLAAGHQLLQKVS